MVNYLRMNIVAMLVGLAMDFIIGDPEGWPHPVIWIGRYISFMEKKLRARGGNLRGSAVFLTASTVALAMLLTACVLLMLSWLGKLTLFIGMCVFSWWCISEKCLAKEARGVAEALTVSLDKARTRLRRIVGRDTEKLSEEEIIRATIETVAENTTDGIISPMLYLAIGGPILGLGFKAVSTLDSMVGYLDEKYRDIGWSSAKLDDALNFIPARICGVLMSLAAGICGLYARNAFRTLRRDHANHLSPNCGWSEAAAAGALGIQLGGTHSYFGKPVEKPTIGDATRRAERADIARMNRLMFMTTLLWAAVWVILWAVLACVMFR